MFRFESHGPHLLQRPICQHHVWIVQQVMVLWLHSEVREQLLQQLMVILQESIKIRHMSLWNSWLLLLSAKRRSNLMWRLLCGTLYFVVYHKWQQPDETPRDMRPAFIDSLSLDWRESLGIQQAYSWHPVDRSPMFSTLYAAIQDWNDHPSQICWQSPYIVLKSGYSATRDTCLSYSSCVHIVNFDIYEHGRIISLAPLQNLHSLDIAEPENDSTNPPITWFPRLSPNYTATVP